MWIQVHVDFRIKNFTFWNQMFTCILCVFKILYLSKSAIGKRSTEKKLLQVVWLNLSLYIKGIISSMILRIHLLRGCKGTDVARGDIKSARWIPVYKQETLHIFKGKYRKTPPYFLVLIIINQLLSQFF